MAIDYRTEAVAARVKEATGGRGVDLVLDSVGGKEFTKNFDYLAPLGLVVSYGLLDGPLDPNALTEMRNRPTKSFGIRTFSMHVFDDAPERRRHATRELIGLLRDGKIKPVIYKRLPLPEAATAHAMLEGGEVIGKIILKPASD